ncbi:unnamed protein product, partial [Nesidiocoris tenuis]
ESGPLSGSFNMPLNLSPRNLLLVLMDNAVKLIEVLKSIKRTQCYRRTGPNVERMSPHVSRPHAKWWRKIHSLGAGTSRNRHSFLTRKLTFTRLETGLSGHMTTTGQI